MNRKYIDFVPVRPKKPLVSKPTEELDEIVETEVLKDTPEVVEEVFFEEETFSAGDVGENGFSIKQQEPVFGVVEDFRPKFVKTEVAKRPLSRSHFSADRGSLAEAKAEKVSAKKINKRTDESKESTEKDKKDNSKMKIPKTPFVNQAKVAKRPLSKNVYERTVQPTKEVPTGPVTIISKPEKDSKASLVVTIILTIILGAAAGTVAFLILPK